MSVKTAGQSFADCWSVPLNTLTRAKCESQTLRIDDEIETQTCFPALRSRMLFDSSGKLN